MDYTQDKKKQNRRSYPRVALESLVRIRCPGGKSFSAPIRDISRTGISAICNREVHDCVASSVDQNSPGDGVFRLTFSLDPHGDSSSPIVVLCSLAHMSPREKYFLAGFEFRDFEAQGDEIIESFIVEAMRW